MTGRVVFADQLRGIAALCVAYSHLVGVFWFLPDLVNAVTGAPLQPGSLGGFLPYILTPWWNAGPFGVGLFFLISGFVIPLSLGAGTPGRFLLARALRIYPVYLAAMALEAAASAASRAWWGQPVHYDLTMLLGNALLLFNYLGLSPFDMASWTLCIEVKFYVLIAVIARPVARGSLGVVFVSAAVLTAISLGASAVPSPGPALMSYGFKSSYLIFMLCGVVFSYHLRQQIGGKTLVAGVAMLTGLFFLCYFEGIVAGQYGFSATWSIYLSSLGLFTALYAARRYVRPFRPLDAMARISYPFCLIHALVGFSLLRLFTSGFRVSYWPALALTVGVLLTLATVLHVTLERWTIRAGHRLRAPARRAGYLASASYPAT